MPVRVRDPCLAFLAPQEVPAALPGFAALPRGARAGPVADWTPGRSSCCAAKQERESATLSVDEQITKTQLNLLETGTAILLEDAETDHSLVQTFVYGGCMSIPAQTNPAPFL